MRYDRHEYHSFDGVPYYSSERRIKQRQQTPTWLIVAILLFLAVVIYGW